MDGARGRAARLHCAPALHILVPAGGPLPALDQDLTMQPPVWHRQSEAGCTFMTLKQLCLVASYLMRL